VAHALGVCVFCICVCLFSSEHMSRVP